MNIKPQVQELRQSSSKLSARDHHYGTLFLPSEKICGSRLTLKLN